MLGRIEGWIGEHRTLAFSILLILVVLLLNLAGFLIARSRKKAASGAAPSPAAPPRPPRPPRPKIDVLEAAWKRFEQGLPPLYRRSILNFEHFVVMGAAASGKSTLIDTYSDWKRQTKEFVSSQASDPDLPVYLASREVIMELPARILEDHGEVVYQTLNRLWRPIYRERAPTVVAVVDVVRLARSAPDVVQDLAEKMRGKINVLSAIRGRAIEVRVALTHLDEIEGYKEFASFCRDREIPLRVTPPPTPPLDPSGVPERLNVARHLDAWWEEIRGYLPNELTSLRSADFRRLVSFLRKAPDVTSALKPFLKALLKHEAVALDPIYSGIYLASDPPGVANPLSSALESGLGPDPQRRHLVAAAVLATACAVYLGLAFNAQYTRWDEADQALKNYRPVDDAGDPQRRAPVCAFTSKSRGLLERHPDFFSEIRLEMRKKFSDRIRQYFFIKRFRDVLKDGTLVQGGVPMAARRSIFYLGVIHSDKQDKLKILQPGEPEIWASMLELPNNRDTDFLVDYLENVDEAYKTRVDFDLPDQGTDPRDGSKEWIDLLELLDRSLRDGVVTPGELQDLKGTTNRLGPRLARFEHDERMRRILRDIDLAASTEIYRTGTQPQSPLRRYYEAKYEAFLKQTEWASDWELRRKLRRIVDMVDATVIEVEKPRTVSELVYRLEQLYGANAGDIIDDEQVVSIRIDNQERQVPSGKWAQILRDSKAEQYITSFLSGGLDASSFIGPQEASALPPAVWNPNGDAAAVFVGRGVIDGRYTPIAYNRHVREMLPRLDSVLTKATIKDELKVTLRSAVTDQIGRYAARYREEGVRFTQSFDVQARSQEALRVALAQMVNDTSAFNDFLLALEINTRLDMNPPVPSSVRMEMSAFDSWHLVVTGGGAGGAPEIGKYKSILGQLLLDLGPPLTPGAPSAGAIALPTSIAPAPSSIVPSAGVSANPETLESILSPAGRLYLAELRGERGSYAGLVENWLTSVRMPEAQRKPFRAPIRRLAELGRVDLERAIWRVWQVDIQPSVQRVAVRFPFTRTAADEVTPEELRELFHPSEGRIFDLFRRYIEPLVELTGRSPFQPRLSVARGVTLPSDLFPAINAAVALSSRLWDSAGNPTPIELKIDTVRFSSDARPKFEGDTDRRLALTLMYLNIGEGSVFNFNQKPSRVTVGFDWPKDLRSQVGIQLTDTVTKENTFPPPLVSSGTYWSFYHLLLRAQLSPVKSPKTAQLYTWEVWHQPDFAPGQMIPVRFVTVNDPWEPFAAIGRFAPRPREVPKESKKESPRASSKKPSPSAEAP